MKPRFHLILLTVAVAGCTRYEWRNELDVPGLCDRSRSTEPSGVLRQIDDSTGRAGFLIGRVRDRFSGSTLAEARVRVTDSARTLQVVSDSTGSFRLQSPPPGRYSVAVARIGYQSIHHALDLTVGASNIVDIQLAPTVHDGPCSGFAAVAVRKPWWKLW